MKKRQYLLDVHSAATVPGISEGLTAAQKKVLVGVATTLTGINTAWSGLRALANDFKVAHEELKKFGLVEYRKGSGNEDVFDDPGFTT